MDEDDSSAAEAHQQELERRELEERHQQLRVELRAETKIFEQDMQRLNESIRSETCLR